MKKRKMNPQSLANLRPPIRPGEVLNPLGINRKKPYTDRMRTRSDELLKASPEGRRILKSSNLGDDATWADAVILELMRKAATGDLPAIKEVIDRIEGKTTTFEEERVDAKEAHVYLVVGDEKKLETVLPVDGNVEITGGIYKSK